MSDIPTSDPDRILLKTRVGEVQAFPAHPTEVSVTFGLFAHASYTPSTAVYVNHNIYMTAEDARALAAALIKAAEHAEKVAPKETEEVVF